MSRGRRLAGVVAALSAVGAAVALAGPAASSGGPRVSSLTCAEKCAAARTTAGGGRVRFHGRGLGGTAEVRFPGAGGALSVTPASVAAGAVEAIVPDGAASGKPSLLDSGGAATASPRSLRIVTEGELPSTSSFKLISASARPRRAFFDGRAVRLRYSFRAYGARDVKIELLHHGHAIKRWSEADRSPFGTHSVRWDGLREHGGAASRGRYSFRIAPGGRRAAFRFFDHMFPVRASHSYGDRFGVSRSGGRTHQGQDVWAHCGAPLVAARGGKVQLRAYSGSLYGYYVVIDERESSADYMYAHLLPRVRVKQGDEVHTGQRIGSVGKTGNARGEACQLHFEYWPGGRPQSHPVDPLPLLRRWDRWS